MVIQNKIGNPYLEEYLQTVRGQERFSSRVFAARFPLVGKYSWAIPSENVIEVIAKYSPLIEIGAGTGYWARMLDEAGADVVAFDQAPPNIKENPYCRKNQTWFNVQEGGPHALRSHKDRTLFLCWPPYQESMASDCLKNYKGQILLYIGEGTDGCTGDDTFKETLKTKWEKLESVSMNSWPSLYDNLFIYGR